MEPPSRSRVIAGLFDPAGLGRPDGAQHRQRVPAGRCRRGCPGRRIQRGPRLSPRRDDRLPGSRGRFGGRRRGQRLHRRRIDRDRAGAGVPGCGGLRRRVERSLRHGPGAQRRRGGPRNRLDGPGFPVRPLRLGAGVLRRQRRRRRGRDAAGDRPRGDGRAAAGERSGVPVHRRRGGLPVRCGGLCQPEPAGRTRAGSR